MRPKRPPTSIRPGQAILLFATALALRVWHVLAMQHSPFFQYPLVDAATYHDAAKSIALGLGHSDGVFWQPPGYPYFLGAIYAIVARADVLAPRLVQAALGAATAVLTAWIGARVFGRRVGLAAGWGWACYGTSIYFDGELLATSLTVTLQVAAVALALSAPGAKRKGRRWAAAGALGGLASLATATSLVLVAVLAAFSRRRAGWVLAAAALVISPATLHNAVRGGAFIPISYNAGVNLFIGNNPRYEETVEIRPGPAWHALASEPIAHGARSPRAQSNYYVGKVVSWARRDPLAFLGLQFHKLRLLVAGSELRRNQEIYPAREYSPVLRALLWKLPGLALPFGLVAPLAALGAVMHGRRAPLLVAAIAAYGAAVVAFFIAARYRVPLVPYLLVLGAAGVLCWRESPGRMLRLAAVGAAVAVYALANLDQGPMPTRMNADAEFILAGNLQLEGRLDEAERHYRLALEDRADMQESWTNLGVLLMQLGKIAGADSALTKALALHPAQSTTLVNLAMLRETQGRIAEAVTLYERAARVDPTDPYPRARIRHLTTRR